MTLRTFWQRRTLATAQTLSARPGRTQTIHWHIIRWAQINKRTGH